MLFSGSAAVGADANDAQEVLRDLEPVLGGHRVLERFELSGKEFDDLAALGTDHVIVVLMFVVVLVVRAPVAEPDFPRESRVGQEFQRAIDGSLTDVRILFLHEPVEVFVGEMFLGAQENIQDQVTLGGALESLLLNVFEEEFLLLRHWLRASHV